MFRSQATSVALSTTSILTQHEQEQEEEEEEEEENLSKGELLLSGEVKSLAKLPKCLSSSLLRSDRVSWESVAAAAAACVRHRNPLGECDDVLVVLMGTIKSSASPLVKWTRSLLSLWRHQLITAPPPARALFPLDKAE
ncbi:hypothetical protein JOB18_043935 [Solea senegalensis]|uniref:Uncharacterized protein n=1 Tax=Solea senegalensis TaxID=28829 RepID=A0AAV6S5I0_SOLSE|nr:hypothetical protein JOB18_043935 [Solea senegalensis]